MKRLTNSPVSLRVFLCHSSGDKPIVRELYSRLKSNGFAPWLDEHDLLPGQDWKEEIPKAVRASDVVVVCLSKISVTKEGYVQKEIKFALDVEEEKPPGTIFIVPVRLDEVEVPGRLAKWQWVDLFQEGGYEQLVRSLKHRFAALAAMEITRNASFDAEQRVRSLLNPGASQATRMFEDLWGQLSDLSKLVHHGIIERLHSLGPGEVFNIDSEFAAVRGLLRATHQYEPFLDPSIATGIKNAVQDLEEDVNSAFDALRKPKPSQMEDNKDPRIPVFNQRYSQVRNHYALHFDALADLFRKALDDPHISFKRTPILEELWGKVSTLRGFLSHDAPRKLESLESGMFDINEEFALARQLYELTYDYAPFLPKDILMEIRSAVKVVENVNGAFAVLKQARTAGIDYNEPSVIKEFNNRYRVVTKQYGAIADSLADLFRQALEADK